MYLNLWVLFFLLLLKRRCKDFPGGPVVKNLPSNAGMQVGSLVGKLRSHMLQFSSVQPLSCVRLFETPWTVAHQASLSIINSRSLLRLMPIESVMPSNHFIRCHPFLLPPSIFPSIGVFSNESVLCIRWPKYWSFSFSISISPSNEY